MLNLYVKRYHQYRSYLVNLHSTNLNIVQNLPKCYSVNGKGGQKSRQPGQVRKEAAVTNRFWVTLSTMILYN